MEEIEIDTIDTRLEHTRQKDTTAERRLLASIQERDIRTPLCVAQDTTNHKWVLLDGFKRYRCAKKLQIPMLPVEYIGVDVVMGIVGMLRRNESTAITVIEQAALIDELHKQYQMSTTEIALLLERSPSWVSLRLGMIEELSPLVRQKIMSGAFSARAYLYGIRSFTRVNKIPSNRIDTCVQALSNKNLGTRDLSVLSRAYFNGDNAIQQLIVSGDVHKALRMLKSQQLEPAALYDSKQQQFLNDLQHMSTTMRRITNRKEQVRGIDTGYQQSVNLWCSALLETIPSFKEWIIDLHEKTRPSNNSANPLPAGTQQALGSASVSD